MDKQFSSCWYLMLLIVVNVCWRLTAVSVFTWPVFSNTAYLQLCYLFLLAVCGPEKYLRFRLSIGATLDRLASSSSPSLWPIHAFTWREARNPTDTGRWDPKRFPPATAAATANKCCRKYAIASATCPSRLIPRNWTSAALGKCTQRTWGRRGAAATPSTPTTRPCRRSANPWCPSPTSRARQAPRRTSTCPRNPRLWALRRWD